MLIKLKVEKEYDIKYLSVNVNVRHWEDAELNGETLNEAGEGMPRNFAGSWCPLIDIESGLIVNWDKGNTASLHFKVCDEGFYQLLSSDNDIIIEKEGYVPSCLCPKENGYGDYLIMDIQENGQIEGWKFDSYYFTKEED